MASSFKPSRLQQQHRAVFDSFTIGSPKETPSTTVDPFLIRPQSTSSAFPSAAPVTHTAWTETTKLKEDELSVVYEKSKARSTELNQSEPVSLRSSTTFSPPNCIDEADERRGRPATSWARGREPVKVAGDVSLTGAQLLPFLIKATMRLPSVKGEGVQIRLQQLEELIDQDVFSETCIKNLNFVVDAIDRGAYDEAWRYYELMKKKFPEEMSSNWAHGLRLLIRELMPQQRGGRVLSAGHVRNH
ncbi:unnamed protein product [Caenorhabditis auriculariae]|uniref:Uncharacterized protein n=1 Tax=Caenorhabditis auriculariae TaxID=2777116 RepID=A0A8S1GZS7_9PELO|nr:unnamed protein product [Caenorhabditis auriculariae]